MMQMTKLRLTGRTPIELPIIGAKHSDVYICKGVDGLGPTQAGVSIARTSRQGGVYKGRQPELREIVARVGLHPDYRANQTSTDLRDELYGLMNPGYGEEITIKIMNGITPLMQTQGCVERIEAALFTEEPEVQITIPCLSAYFNGPNEIEIVPTTKSSFVIPNEGTAPTGFKMEVVFTANLPNLTITKPVSKKKMQFDYAFLTADRLVVDTRPGSKNIELIRGTKTINLIDSLSVDSDWLDLHKGNNDFLSNAASFNWKYFTFTPQFLGV